MKFVVVTVFPLCVKLWIETGFGNLLKQGVFSPDDSANAFCEYMRRITKSFFFFFCLPLRNAPHTTVPILPINVFKIWHVRRWMETMKMVCKPLPSIDTAGKNRVSFFVSIVDSTHLDFQTILHCISVYIYRLPQFCVFKKRRI